jgi:ribonucleoside-diphosphate reductase alpha chain
MLAAIGDVIERHMIEIGFLPAKHQRSAVADRKMAAGDTLLTDQRSRPLGLAQCPKCGQAALIRIEGCDQCTSCDYSKCW